MNTYHINVYPRTDRWASKLTKKTFKVKAPDKEHAKKAVKDAIADMELGIITTDYEIEFVEELELEIQKTFTEEEKLLTLLRAALNPDWCGVLAVASLDDFDVFAENLDDTSRAAYSSNYWALLEYLRAGGITSSEEFDKLYKKIAPWG